MVDVNSGMNPIRSGSFFDGIPALPEDAAVIFVNTAILKENLGSYGERLLACFRLRSGEVPFRWIEKP